MKKYLYIITILFTVLQVNVSKAMPWPDYTPLMPVAPQFCPMCTPAMFTQVQSVIQEVMSIKDMFNGKKILTSVMQSAKGYLVTMGRSKFNYLKQKITARKKVVSASRTIETCSIAGDITDEAKVKDAFIELFLQYPSKKTRIKKAYAENAAQFQIDTAMEMYITAQEMSKELEVMLTELDNIEKCLVAGEECSGEGLEAYNCQQEGQEDEVCLWRNALNSARIYDRIMRYNEYLTAMNAQLNAVNGIGDMARIREFKDKKEKKEKHSYNQLNIRNNPSVAESKMVYMSKEETSAYASEISERQFESLTDAGIRSPVEGKEAEFESMEIINEAQIKINDAVAAHNYKQNLPEYLSIFTTYHEMEDYHNKAVEYLNTSSQCIENYLSGRYKNSTKAWMGNDCVKSSDGYHCRYSSPKGLDDKGESIGKYDVPCGADKKEKCYVISENNYTSRSGISGWLMALLEESQKTEATTKDDIYITLETRIVDTDVEPFDKLKQESNKAYKKDKTGTDEATLKQPSMEEDMYAESRKNSIMNWTIGAKVAEAIYKDSAKGQSKFGVGTSKTVLWNDQKMFYNLYLNGKYENIREYIKNMVLLDVSKNGLNKLAELGEAKVNVKDVSLAETILNSRKEIAQLPKLLEQQTDNHSKITQLIAEEDKALNELTQKYNKEISELMNLKKTTYTELDDLSRHLDGLNKNLNTEYEKIDTSTTETPISEEALDYGKKLQRGSDVSPQNLEFTKNISKNEEMSSEAHITVEELKVQEARLKNKIKTSRSKLEEINKSIDEIGARYILRYAVLEEAYKNKIDNFIKEQKANGAQSVIAELFVKNKTLAVVNKLSTLIKKYLLLKLDETVEKINKMQQTNEAYYPQSGKKIVEIHNEFLQAFNTITLDGLLADSKIGEELSKLFKETPMLKKYVDSMSEKLAEVAKNKETPDTDYFVSAFGNERDLQAPKSAVNFASAPMREIFHFDAEDYSSVLRYTAGGTENVPQSNKKITLAKISLLNSGIDIPEIWKYILRRRSFVEQDIDLDKLLNGEGNPGQTLMYSGIYPCRTSEGEIVVSKIGGNRGYTKNVSGGENNYIKQMCANLNGTKGGIEDLEANTKVSLGGETNPYTTKSSELGQILDYIPIKTTIKIGDKEVTSYNKLTFRQELQDAIYGINTATNVGENGGDNLKYHMYNRMLFSRNMFGDYLDNVEVEKTSAQTLADIEIQIKEVQNNIKEIFEELGYSLSDDFDLSKVDDYNLALRVLEEHKNLSIEEAKRLIGTIKGETEYVQQKKQELEHGIKVLEKDSEEVTTISPNDDLAELEEKIKTSQANKDVVDVYEEEGSKAFKKNTKQLHPPYCAVYPI